MSDNTKNMKCAICHSEDFEGEICVRCYLAPCGAKAEGPSDAPTGSPFLETACYPCPCCGAKTGIIKTKSRFCLSIEGEGCRICNRMTEWIEKRYMRKFLIHWNRRQNSTENTTSPDAGATE